MGGHLSLLIVEDSPADEELVLIELRRHGYDVAVERVDSGPALRAALAAKPWDIVLCDHGLPSFDSGEALSIVRGANSELPFVILSGSIGEEAAVEALTAGARDVVLKSNLSRLGLVVDRELAEAENHRRHRHAEEALQESEARKTAILESALDGVITIDHDGLIVDFNPAAERMFGFPRSEVGGKPMAELIVPPSLRDRHESAFLRHLATGERTVIGRRLELTGMRADGAEFPVELSITRGELSGRPFFTGYVRDLSEHRRAEEERANLEAQLRQAQKMDAIGSLAGGITHDFNNILAVVNGYSDLLLRRLADDDPIRPQVEEIARAGDKAATLTRQLLAFTRRQVLEPRVLDLNSVVREIEPLLQRVIGEDVELVTRLDSELEPVRADAGQLEQVVVNLAVNARDAMPAGGVLTIATRNADFDCEQPEGTAIAPVGGGRYAMLSVSDDGAGMDAATKERVFEPFFTTKEVGSGTGLGLSTVYGIIKQSRGHIFVRSEPGQGSTFSVCLPAVEAPVDPPERPIAPDRPVRGSATILLVEDDEGMLRLVQELLEHDGFTALTARNSTEAIDIFDRERDAIGLVITDLVMPGMGGLDLCRELRRLRPEIGFLFMSGYSSQQLDDAGAHGPGTAFLQKPFTPLELNVKIRELLDST